MGSPAGIRNGDLGVKTEEAQEVVMDLGVYGRERNGGLWVQLEDRGSEWGIMGRRLVWSRGLWVGEGTWAGGHVGRALRDCGYRATPRLSRPDPHDPGEPWVPCNSGGASPASGPWRESGASRST